MAVRSCPRFARPRDVPLEDGTRTLRLLDFRRRSRRRRRHRHRASRARPHPLAQVLARSRSDRSVPSRTDRTRRLHPTNQTLAPRLATRAPIPPTRFPLSSPSSPASVSRSRSPSLPRRRRTIPRTSSCPPPLPPRASPVNSPTSRRLANRRPLKTTKTRAFVPAPQHHPRRTDHPRPSPRSSPSTPPPHHRIHTPVASSASPPPPRRRLPRNLHPPDSTNRYHYPRYPRVRVAKARRRHRPTHPRPRPRPNHPLNRSHPGFRGRNLHHLHRHHHHHRRHHRRRSRARRSGPFANATPPDPRSSLSRPRTRARANPSRFNARDRGASASVEWFVFVRSNDDATKRGSETRRRRGAFGTRECAMYKYGKCGRDYFRHGLTRGARR